MHWDMYKGEEAFGGVSVDLRKEKEHCMRKTAKEPW